MKTIYFIRHAKVVKDDFSIDFHRNLTQNGQNNAILIATKLKEKNVNIEKIITSPAKRTLKTAKIFAQILDFKDKIIKEEKLYASDITTIMQIIHKLNNDLNNVAIVGHNDEITQVCEFLSNTALTNIPTSGVVAIEFDIKNFADIKENSGKIVFFEYPKKYI